MTQQEALAAWRLFSFNWIPVGLMALALALGLALTDFSIKPASVLLPFGVAAAYIGVAYYKATRSHKRDPLVIFVLGSTGQIVLIPALITPLTYIAAAADFPMRDASLAALDRALGLDWPAYFSFVYGWPALLAGLVLAYNMIGVFAFGVPVVLGVARRYRRLQEFILAFVLALVAVTGSPAARQMARATASSGTRTPTRPVPPVTSFASVGGASTSSVSGPGQNRSASRAAA
jgi:hypothetical protein